MSRIALPFLLCLAAAGGLAACGTEDFNPDVVAQAADKTASAGGAKVAFTIDAAGQAMHGDGFMDAKGRKGRLSFALPQGQGKLETLFLQRVVYLHLPEKLSAQVPGGKPWLKLDLDKVAKAQGIDLGALQSTSNSNPSQQLDQLRGAGEVKRVGTEKIRGTQTTHYRAKIDLRRAAEKAPAAQREAARRSVERLIKIQGSRTVPIDAWIDSQGRLRRERVAQRVQGQSLDFTMDLYDFGTQETLNAPPAADTQDFSTVLSRAGRQRRG
jgi:hypothetical protein